MNPVISQLTPDELKVFLEAHPDTILLDVREDDEVAFCSLPNHVHIPMNMIPLRHNELPDGCPIVLYCHHGIRSLHSAMYLAEAGFEDLYNLKGGIDAWALEVDPEVPRY
ncbi:MAG: rhodanese-like domain-containing protein [Neisseria sp.]|uniref:rhodanese-like domain-containing protein n=1 Tax=Neisseria sp. TaxID=192066 RepID=UPI0026DD4C1E|nr:rhodanese-like domain-containing protein [Neisseria sp.]MDO4641184.1 rhodanese-like domain-containing protein [Neisseria sp.]